MTTTMIFADFNEPQAKPDAVPIEDLTEPMAEQAAIHDAAWTEGYLTGRRERVLQDDDRTLTAKLMTSVAELDAKAADAVDAASLAVADLLVSTVIAVTTDEWPARLMDRVRLAAEHIKPALTVAPDFILKDDQGALHHFENISELSRALEAGNTGEDVSIRWHRGEATISRTALLEDLRHAMAPLSAGLVNEQTVRSPT